MPSYPIKLGNPVISTIGPSDTIHYGADLEEYLTNEFIQMAADRLRRSYDAFPEIPYWDGLFFDAYKRGPAGK